MTAFLRLERKRPACTAAIAVELTLPKRIFAAPAHAGKMPALQSKARIPKKDECRRFVDGVVLLLAVCVLGRVAFTQTQAQSDWPENEARLARQLASGDLEQKRSALFEIRNLQTERASCLAVPTLKDANEIVRATAASSVIFLPKTEAVNALVPLLEDRAEFVRREAAYALGNIGSPETSAPLLRLMQKEKIMEVRSAGVIALGKSGDPMAIGPLVQILKARPNDESEFLRRSAARSIGQIAQIARTGNRIVLTPRNFLPDRSKEIGNQTNPNTAAKLPALDSAVAVLTQVLKSKNESDDTRREAAFALGAIGNTSSASVLHANQTSSDPYLAEICKEALLKIGGVEINSLHTVI